MTERKASKLKQERMLVTENIYGSVVRIDDGKGGGPRRISAPNVKYTPEGATEAKYGTLYTVPEALTAAVQLLLQSVDEIRRQSDELAEWKEQQKRSNGREAPVAADAVRDLVREVLLETNSPSNETIA